MIRPTLSMALLGAFLAVPLACSAADKPSSKTPDANARHIAASMEKWAQPTQSVTNGKVRIDGQTIAYKAVAGTLTLHGHGVKEAVPTARIFYTAYFTKGVKPGKRPVTFIYNGGPGSSSLWLHMGAFGPKRVTTRDDSHTPAAPYKLVNNDDSLLDATDLVFVDAPGTGFSRLIAEDRDAAARKKLMKKRRKQFYSVDGDAHAFAQFITRFLSKYERWNSPKYLFGESYGTTRSAVLADILQNHDSIDLNGVILLSQVLNFDDGIDGPQANPGVDLPYALALPSYAATAWYHHKLPNRPAALKPFLHKVEQFAIGPYASALMAGSALDAKRKNHIAQQLHQFTGLKVAYLKKANLRVNGGEFEKNLLGGSDETTGRLDTRFAGPTLDPLSEGSQYDPQSSSISSAYVSAFNSYMRSTLKFGGNTHYRAITHIERQWDFSHKQPQTNHKSQGATNVMPDLANAMKTNPNLKIMLNGGYFDLATPFFAGIHEMHHLPMPDKLQKNISYHYYQSGHMVYAHLPALKKLHHNVAAFIARTDNQGDSQHSQGNQPKSTPDNTSDTGDKAGEPSDRAAPDDGA